MTVALAVIAVIAVLILIILAAAIRILREYERGVIFRLGRLIAQKGPGLILLIPFIDQMVRIDLRTVTLNVPPQEVITKDNVTVRVNAVAYFRVLDPNKAITEVENFLLATSQIAQTTLRSVLGKAELDALLSERERLNVELQQIIDEQTEPWGMKVSTVEVKDVELPASTCSGRCRARPRPSASGGRRSSPPTASSRPPRSSRRRRTSSARTRRRCSCATCRRWSRSASTTASTIVFPLPLDLLKPLLDAARARRACRRPATQPPRPPHSSPEPHPRSASTSSPGCGRSSPRAAPSAQTPSTRTAEPRPDALGALPVLRGPRGPHAARGLGRPPGRWRARHARLDAALGAEPLPGARPGAGRRATATSDEADRPSRASPARSTRSAPPTRGQADLFRSQPATGAHEVIVSAPEHATSLAQLCRTSGSPARSPPGASGCAPTPTPPTCT